MTTPPIRVFVDARGIEVPSGSVALDAVRSHDAVLADDVRAGRRVITDSRGLPIAEDTPVVAGSILRVIARRDRVAGPPGGRGAVTDGSMPVVDRELLRRIPKAELHCHLDGSVRPQTLIELGEELGVPMPRGDAESLRRFMLVADARNLEEYLEGFVTTLSVMQTPAAIERIAYELAEDASRDGVRYLEVRFAPVLNTREGMDPGATIEAVTHGLGKAQRDFGVIGRVIVCGLRQLPPDVSVELARLAVAYRERGVVAFDLAGGEAGNPASAHRRAFEYALAGGLACTCHAGEGDGAGSVREALHVCGAHRIGHATRLIEDDALTEYVKDHRIPLEICITSNVQTHAASSYEAHPVRAYFDRGLQVVLNTDNRLMSGVTLVDEYVHAASRLGFTFDELATVALNGFEAAFIPEDVRRSLLEDARAEIARLRSGANA